MKTAHVLSVIAVALVLILGAAEAPARTGKSQKKVSASNAAYSTVRLCWVIECTGTTGSCYAWGDVFSGQYMVEPGRMNRYKIPCPTGTPNGNRHTRIFAFEPTDPNYDAGYGCTNCDAWVDGPKATVTEYDNSPTQTTFTDWKNSY